MTQSWGQINQKNKDHDVPHHSSGESAAGSLLDSATAISLACIKIETVRRLGIPLMGAVIDVRARSGGARHPARHEEDARHLSALVRISMGLMRHTAGRVAVNNPEQSVAIKLELASCVAPLVADYYKMTGHIPDGDSTVHLLSKIDAILDGVGTQTLGQSIDLSAYGRGQMSGLFAASHVESAVPVVQAVSRFAFGMDEGEALRVIMNRLVRRANRLVEHLTLSEPSLWNKSALEGVMLGCLTRLYQDCHLEEIDYLTQMDDEARQHYAETHGYSYSLDPVWEAFERRTAMLQIIADHLEFQNKSLRLVA